MKANKLMVGNWVKVFDGENLNPVKVMEIHNDKILADDGKFYDLCTTNAIILTKKILEENGFSLYSDKYKGVYKYGTFLVEATACSDLATTYERDIIFECAYVHELQQALNVCAFYDLADNFKIN